MMLEINKGQSLQIWRLKSHGRVTSSNHSFYPRAAMMDWTTSVISTFRVCQFLPLEVGALCNHKTCIWPVCPTWCVWTCIIFLLLNVDLLPYKCRRQRGHAALAHALAHYTICCCKEGMLLKFIIHYTGYKDAHCPGALDNNYAGYKEDMLS